MAQQKKSLRKHIKAPFVALINDSRSVGILLIVSTIVSFVISNGPWGASFISFWNDETLHAPYLNLPHSVGHLVNDGLMAFFFLLVGMEIKRETLSGELSDLRNSALPILAAIGGMVVPALLYLSWNLSSGHAHGWGIPMATDIAFSLGILSLLGNRAPLPLKVMLTALAIIDDLGAIIVIAIFYTDAIQWSYLGLSAGLVALMALMNYTKTMRTLPYYIVGILLWYTLFNSGVHATLAGVLLALCLPSQKIPSIEHKLHAPINFIVLPLFALANTAIAFPNEIGPLLASSINYGILSGLVIGKPLGIMGISFLAVKLKIARLPQGVNWKHILGTGMLAGIGFTMSIFIAMLAFENATSLVTAKISIIIASALSGLAGFFFLKSIKPKGTTRPA